MAQPGPVTLQSRPASSMLPIRWVTGSKGALLQSPWHPHLQDYQILMLVLPKGGHSRKRSPGLQLIKRSSCPQGAVSQVHSPGHPPRAPTPARRAQSVTLLLRLLMAFRTPPAQDSGRQ